MHFQIEEVSPVEKKLAVEIEWPLVSAKLDAAYKELGRDVALKGFRKGKVPRNILERMFSRQVEREVAEKLVQESFVRAAQQHELEPVAAPIVESMEMNKGASMKYSARVEVRATLDPHGYDGIDLEKPEPSVTVDEVDQALERKRQELSEYKQIEGRTTLAATDVIVCEIRGEVADRPLQRDSVMIDLSLPEREPVPGIAAALVGAPVDAKDHLLHFQVPAPDGGEGKRPATLKITIKDAREKLVPALDDDFAKDTGDADTLDELRGKMRERLVLQKEREVTQGLRGALVKELLQRNPFPVAPSLVERQSEELVQRTRLGMAMQGIDMRNVPLDETKMRDTLRPAAVDEVRRIMLLAAIAEKEKVEVTDADVEKRLAEMAKSRQTSSVRLKAELQKDGRFDSLKHQLREEKTLDLLLTRANISPKSALSPSEK